MRVLAGLFGREAGETLRTDLLWRVQPGLAPARDMYDLLAAYYGQVGLYESLRQQFVAAGLWGEGLRGLRNPAFRCVEFYASHVMPGALPGALPIVTEHPNIVDPIHQVWTWGNWAARKQVAIRQLATFGDLFVKVRASEAGDRVYFQLLDPRIVTDFSKDERGYITAIRLDVPQVDVDSAGKVTRRWTYVEVWDKTTMSYRTWRYEGAASVQTPTEQLGTATLDEDMRTFGVDFVPVVHAPFRDVGEQRGVGSFVPVLDKIDELNRVVTRLHQMGFRHIKTIWALMAGGLDGDGRPLPPPRLQTTPVTDADLARVNGAGATQNVAYVGDDAVLPLPGNSKLESLVPNLDYDALLKIGQDTLAEIENDLSEIRWYKIADQGANLSGRAIRLMMGPAIKRVEEARGNAESALVRADQMALTIGDYLGLWRVGSYAAGDFDHTFEEREVMPETSLDRAEEQRARGQAAQAYASAGVPLATIATEVLEMTEDDAVAMVGMAAGATGGAGSGEAVPTGGR